MKKKILAWVLLLALVVSILPTAVFAAVDPNYGMKLTGVDSSDGTKLVMTLSIKGPACSFENGKASVGIKIDSTKLRPVRSNGNALSIGSTGFGTVAGGCTNLDAADQNYLTAAAALGRENAANNIIYYALQPQFNGTVALDDYTDLVRITLEYQNGATKDSLDMTSVQLVTKEEAYDLGQDNIAYVSAVTPSTGFQYGITARGSGDENLAAPEIVYPNSDVINLNGVKLDADNRYVNVPVSLPSAGADVTVPTTATGYYTSDCAEGTAIESGVTYTYSLAMKDGSEVPETVSIGTDGELTVKAGAPEATVVITATGSYTNSKDNTTTASGTFELQLRHGDAEEKSNTDDPKPDDPPKPIGGGDDVEKAAHGVAIYEGTTQVTNSAATSNYQKAVAIPDATENITFDGKVIDQYGDAMTETGTWAVDTTPAGGNPSFANGVVTVSPGAEKGTYTYTYSYGTDPAYSAAVEITVDDNAITWPTLTNDTIVYGQTADALTFDADTGTVTGKGTITGLTFNWKAGQTLNAATTKALMECNYMVDGVPATTAEHSYDITVNKADQEIVTDVDSDINNGVLQIAIDDTIDLNTAVKNADVEGVVSDGTVSYELTDEKGLVTMSGDEITGAKLSSENDEALATLKITAASNDNYNEATREIKVRVTLPVLAATITFDKTNPVFNDVITATITAAADQPDSVTPAVDYTWGQIITGEDGKPKFEPITTGNSEGKLTNAADGVATVTYTPVKEDIGQTLALKVTTPTASEGYGYIHSVQKTMDNPVAKATYSGYAVSVKARTYNSITVTGVENAMYAIALKNAPAQTDEGDGAADTHNWVEGGSDVVFTQDDAGNALLANTDYTVFMKMKASETHAESAVISQDVKTRQKAVTPIPNPGGDPDPIPPDIENVTVTAEINEDNGLKYDSELTASVTVTDTNDPTVVTIGENDWEYQWYRVVPQTEGDPIDQEITNATGKTYTPGADDIGFVLKVKATTKSDCEFYAAAEDSTSDEIDLKDGPEFNNTLNQDPESKAGLNDGAITGLTAGTSYQIAIKPAEGSEAAWQTAREADTDGKLTGLAAGDYLVRIAGSDVQYPSVAKPITVKTAGYSITGVVVSYNAKNAVTYELYAWDAEANAYSENATYTGTAVEAAETTTVDKQSQNFTIQGVADGTYKLVIKKITHVSYTVVGVKVDGADVDLTSEEYADEIRSMSMAAGDVNGNGAVNATDGDLVAHPDNYNATDMTTVSNPEADINGNGAINATDGDIVAHPDNYNKQESDFVFYINS